MQRPRGRRTAAAAARPGRPARSRARAPAAGGRRVAGGRQVAGRCRLRGDSHRDRGADLGELALPHAADLTQLVNAGEPTVLLAPGDDPLRQHRADAGQGVELLFGRAVQVDLAAALAVAALSSITAIVVFLPAAGGRATVAVAALVCVAAGLVAAGLRADSRRHGVVSDLARDGSVVRARSDT